jgi:ppGpp synthetase/RelA/SpoT-type nucleotidyltranferase
VSIGPSGVGIVGVIDAFVSEYERQFDFWDASARTARGLLEAELSSSGLRAIVTSRAKSVDRLVEKLRQRDRETPYSSVAQISGDIADLAGVRVALYFPGPDGRGRASHPGHARRAAC